MKTLVRRWLWRWLARDALVLRPDWKVLSRTERHLVIGSPPATQLLPIRYNQNTGTNWQLRYQLRGNGPGQLRYRLAAPGKEPFCEWSGSVRLPRHWSLALEPDGRLLAEGAPLALLPGRTLPLDTRWLIGDFTFQAENGTTYARQTAHQVTPRTVADADYFGGAVYECYDRDQAATAGQPLEILRRFRPLRGRFLDVGCATGLLVEEALRHGLFAEGVDASAWAVARANERAAGRCRVMDLDQATAADFPHRYDLIVCQSVLEHCADPARVVSLLAAICAPGGIIYAQTLNADSLCHRLLEQDWAGFRDPTHRSPCITADWLKQVGDSAGLQALHFRTYGFWNENVADPVWRAVQSLLQLEPACLLFEEGYGDFVEAVWEKSATPSFPTPAEVPPCTSP